MDRREALKRTALMMGGMLSAPTIFGILNGCTAKPTIDWKPEAFSEDQGILVSQVSEIIIPKTDTPGAKEVGVPRFIDQIVKDVFTKDEREKFIAGLNAFNDDAKKQYGDPFIELNEAKQTEYVKKTHNAAINARGTAGAEEHPFILTIKELTVAGYFTSEVGASKVLQYESVPGAYHGCLPLNKSGNGKTWAT